MLRAHLVYNPRAGRFAPEPVVQLTAQSLREAGWTVDVSSTRDAAHVTELAHAAAQNGYDALIVGGGDGSIGLTVSGLAGSQTALGILPTGTANVLARQLGLPPIDPRRPQTVRKIARLLAGSQVRAADIGECNQNAFLLWAGLGLDAMIVSQAERHRSHWKKRLAVPEYFLRALWTAHRWQGLNCEIRGIRGDGTTPVSFTGNAQMAIASNIPLYAGGLVRLSPDAVLDDAEMDLWLFKGQGTRKVLKHAWNIFRGKHVLDPDAVKLTFQRAEIRVDAPVRLHTDGDPHSPAAEITLELRPKHIRLLVPPTAPERLFSQ